MEATNTLRIAYLSQQAGIRLDDRGGAVVHVKAIIRHLQQAGHHVTFVALMPGRRVICSDDLMGEREAHLGLTGARWFKLFESGVRRAQGILHLPYLALFDSLRFYDACVHNLIGYDVFHERFSMLGIGGVLAAQRLGIPLVLEVNADFLDELDSIGQGPRGLQRLAVRWASALCFRRAAAIVAVSNQLKAHLVRVWGLPAEKITVLPNGADVDRFDPDADPQVARARLGLPEAPTAIFVGSFFPWHAPLDLIESFALVHQQIPEARLYLVGDGMMRPQAEARARQLDLDGSVTFVGAAPHECIPDWLAAADVAVAPFTPFSPGKGGSPLKLFEYMAAGKAIVTSATGQVLEIVSHEENGLLVLSGDVQEFAASIVRLLKDDESRRRLGRNARAQAVDRHSWTQYVSQLETLYRQILDQ